MSETDAIPPDDPAEAVEGGAGPDQATTGIQPLIAELRLLVQDVSALARSELAFQATRARILGGGVRNMALFVVFALFFVFFALGGLTVGLLLALAPLVTAWGATAIVVGALLAGAALCLLGGLGSWRRIKRLLTAGSDQ